LYFVCFYSLLLLFNTPTQARAHKSAANLLQFFEIYKYFGKKMKKARFFKLF